jgi:AraC-like DNA-binding protein
MKNNTTIISKVIDFIEEHLTSEENLDLDKIATMANYSKYHLHRMFSNIVGCTIHQYIQKRRLTEAAHQLVYTDISIMDISLNAGYETQQSFTLAFKRLYEKSPQAYRKKQEFLPIQLRFEAQAIKNFSSYTKLTMNCEVKAA